LWSRLRAETRPVRFLVSRLLWRTGLSHHFVVRRNGYRIRFHPSAVSAAVWTDPSYPSQEEAFVASTLRPGDCYVDVGANVGMLALRAATLVGDTGRVIAIEAHPRTYQFLADNVSLNEFGSMQVIQRAVGDADGAVTFSDYLSDDQNHVVIGGAGVAVPVQRLDDLIPDGPIALLKVDVEGFELPVFRGAPAVLARTRVILFESWDQHAARYGYAVADVLALLRDSGFVLYRLVGSELQPVVGPGRSPGCENLVAIRE
jgi:FkbM family methyltransferase